MKHVRVRCSNGKIYQSIIEAAKAAGVQHWTMGCKMVSAGGFIDKDGNEYTRMDPANFKNQYPNTGKTLKHSRSFHTRSVSQPSLPIVDFEPMREISIKNTEEPVNFDIVGSCDDFTMTIKGLSAQRLAKLIVLITKED